MNRADLGWALNAVLPHTGNEKSGLNYVGLHCEQGQGFFYATDKYTAAIARVNDVDNHGSLALPASEATDLMRWARPQRVPERDTYVELRAMAGELHVGFDNYEGQFESQVFELTEPTMTYSALRDWIRQIDQMDVEWNELILAPKLVEKFAKASRSDSDRLWILPRTAGGIYGAAVMAVGPDFLGAIAGMTYDQQSSARVASFLYPELEQAA